MNDLEDQLRDTVTRRMRDYTPSAELRQRIDTRVRQRRRQRRLVAAAGVLSTGVAALVTVGVLAAPPAGQDQDSEVAEGRPGSATTEPTRPGAPTTAGEPPTSAPPETAPTTGPEETTPATDGPDSTGSPSGTAETTATTGTPGTVVGPPGLEPPDSDEPSWRGCNRQTQAVVEVVLEPDLPSPVCVRVAAHQRLRVRNATGQPVDVSLAGFQANLGPGAARTDDRAFGAYLQPGVHRITVSIYSHDPEVWLMA
jgi:hypothetical protein